MGDFFYYGQKDMIRRLNELAGRGAVVASYMPAVGRSPLGGPNGYMNPAWLDPSLTIYTDTPLAVKAVGKFGYTFLHGGQAQLLYKIATLPQQNQGSYASLRIDALLGGWIADSLTTMTVNMGNRGAFSVDWSASVGTPTDVRFVVFQEADGSHSVYLMFTNSVFAQASFNLQGMGCQSYASPVAANSVSGTAVWDSGANPGDSTYKAPRSVGMSPSTPQGTSFNSVVHVRPKDGNSSAISFLGSGTAQNTLTPGQENEVLRLGIGGINSLAHPGGFGFMATSGTGSLFKEGFGLTLRAYDKGSNAWTGSLLRINGSGMVFTPWLKAGTTDTNLRHDIRKAGVQATEIFQVGREGSAAPCFGVNGSDGLGGWNTAASVLYVGKNGTTLRSIGVPGTVNTMGNDYAEYIFKSLRCGVVAAGQIIGITADNQITDKWVDAVMFSIKSTAPSFVGGDSWANDIGSRPSPQAGPAPTLPLRREDVVTQQPVPGTNPPEFEDVVTEPGDTDDEWAEKQAAYTTALAAHNIAVQQDAEAMAAFDAALEVERQKVDRIAIAGRVPVNVLGAQPGDYIVPVQDGAGIKGIAVHEDDLDMKLYLRAVGRVISIEPDGRAYVMVKVV
ncbi:hypothetical protein O0882_15790 [Janthinobacterium sp. SUN073]|uniref:hypothetical protein n=1 Tax=Janthinobacterium sp. SUN073 TaxID=3004102 RepID=UPI0025B1A922|nr:hypothetical protein [Janthinobacterium sp. SUN073]MDN2697781.1 hypothetical protein [Janthinobacterium sp. SUN073]